MWTASSPRPLPEGNYSLTGGIPGSTTRKLADSDSRLMAVMCRMGYLIVGVMLIIVLVLLIGALSRGKPPAGTLSNKPVVREEPSADETTPSASDTASEQQAEQARRHTPPS